MRIINKTNLFPVPQLSGICQANVWVKREDQLGVDGLDAHTTKIRRCAELINEMAQGQKAVFVQITQGNYGYTLGKLAQEAKNEGKDVTVVNIISPKLAPFIKEKLRECSVVVEMDLGKELITDDRLRHIAIENTGCTSEQVRLVHTYPVGAGYDSIIEEIKAAGVTPNYIFCPVGSGELAVALTEAAQATWGTNAPKIIGVTIPENAAINYSSRPWWKIFSRKIRPHIAEKLVDPVAVYRYHIEQLIAERKISLIRLIDEREIIHTHRWLIELGIPNEPSAAVAFLGAMNWRQYSKYGFEPDASVVIINTGKGIYDQAAVEKRWKKKLLQLFKYAGVAAIGSIATFFLTIGTVAHYLRETKLQRYVLELTAEQALTNYKGGVPTSDDILNYCSTIPKKPGTSCNPSLSDWTDQQLEYLVWYNIYCADGWLCAAMRPQLRQEYLDGTLEIYPRLSEQTTMGLLRDIRRALYKYFSNPNHP